MRFLKIFIVVFLITSSIVLILQYNKPSSIFLVVTKNGEVYRAKKVNWYKSGFIDIRKCDGGIIALPENSIDTVKKIK